eukprot:gene28257-24468_t
MPNSGVVAPAVWRRANWLQGARGMGLHVSGKTWTMLH